MKESSYAVHYAELVYFFATTCPNEAEFRKAIARLEKICK